MSTVRHDLAAKDAVQVVLEVWVETGEPVLPKVVGEKLGVSPQRAGKLLARAWSIGVVRPQDVAIETPDPNYGAFITRHHTMRGWLPSERVMRKALKEAREALQLILNCEGAATRAARDLPTDKGLDVAYHFNAVRAALRAMDGE